MMLSELTVSVSVPSSGDSSAVAAARLAMLPAPSAARRQPSRRCGPGGRPVLLLPLFAPGGGLAGDG